MAMKQVSETQDPKAAKTPPPPKEHRAVQGSISRTVLWIKESNTDYQVTFRPTSSSPQNHSRPTGDKTYNSQAGQLPGK